MTAKPSNQLTLKDRLSRLTFRQAVRLLGEEGEKLIYAGGRYEFDLQDQVTLTDEQFELRLPEGRATIELDPAARDKLRLSTSEDGFRNPLMGAALSLILEEKLALGLARAPKERVPIEALSEAELVERALAEREERAQNEKMTVRSEEPHRLWTDYTVTNKTSGKAYRVSLRGWDRGQSVCTCPDYRLNTLGTCKHIMQVRSKVRRRFTAAQRKRPYRPRSVEIFLGHGEDLCLRAMAPPKADEEVATILEPVAGRPVHDVFDLVRRIRSLEQQGHEVRIHPDAEEYIQQRLHIAHMEQAMAEIRRDPAAHPLRTTLLNAELLPYQLDGIAFAVGAGRAILADDMGLGKTIQGIGVAELLAREAGIRSVLVVCPTSLKSQWRSELLRFAGRDCQVVLGSARDRATQYANGSFFTICNYEQVLRDILSIERADWDLIILDEAQRIKNWEAKTTRIVKGLRSRFALALTGTPVENRLDDLYSIVEFIDDRRLGPAFRFFNRHRVVDEKGKVLGYRNLNELRKRLRPVLLRRTRESVMKELPPRTLEIVRMQPTPEQAELHRGHKMIVSTILNKAFISEMDLLRLQKALLMCRMTADSTFLVDKHPPGFSSKLERLEELLGELAAEQSRKIVLFSEWTTMLDLIEPALERLAMDYVRLDGSVPQKKRQVLVNRFQRTPECKVFITTNAGSTGLNLQAANTVINVDLPWNPAVLEQRIARAHRMGQKRPVHVYVLVTEDTLEESLLATLSAKKELALAALELDSDVETVELESGMEELRQRLEVLIGAVPETPSDKDSRAVQEKAAVARRERVEQAGGQLLTAAFAFLGELLPPADETERTQAVADHLHNQLTECLDQDAQGRPRLTVTLPDEEGLRKLAGSLGRVLAQTGFGGADAALQTKPASGQPRPPSNE